MPPKRPVPVAVPSSFIHKLTRSSIESMHIPDGFYSHHCSTILNKSATIEGPNGNTFSVEVNAAGCFYKAGWKLFLKNNCIKEGDTLVFKVTTDETLSCEVYGETGCSKSQDAGVAASSARKRAKDATETVQDESDATDIEAAINAGVNAALSCPEEEQRFVLTDCEVVLTVKKRHGTIRKEPVVQIDMARASAKDKEAAAPKVTPRPISRAGPSSTKNKEPVKTTTPTPASNNSPSLEEITPLEAAASTPSSKKPATTPKSFPKMAKTIQKKSALKSTTKKALAMVVPDDDPKPDPKSASRSASKSAKKPESVSSAVAAAALAQAVSFQTDNPHIVIVMKKSHVKPYFLLTIPKLFANEHLPKGNTTVEIDDGTGKSWEVKWLSPKFSGGWNRFVTDHNIRLGEACVLETTDDPKKVTMHVFRGSADEHAGALAVRQEEGEGEAEGNDGDEADDMDYSPEEEEEAEGGEDDDDEEDEDDKGGDGEGDDQDGAEEPSERDGDAAP